jgi:hypothetical protein
LAFPALWRPQRRFQAAGVRSEMFRHVPKDSRKATTMAQRGRQSAASLSVVRMAKRARPRLTPPAPLSKGEQSVFDSLAACNEHLTPTDSCLLASYAQAVVKTLKLGKEKGAVADWERSARVMAMLARSLRLSPQSTCDPKTLARKKADAAGGLRKPWEGYLDGDDENWPPSDPDSDDDA